MGISKKEIDKVRKEAIAAKGKILPWMKDDKLVKYYTDLEFDVIGFYGLSSTKSADNRQANVAELIYRHIKGVPIKNPLMWLRKKTRLN